MQTRDEADWNNENGRLVWNGNFHLPKTSRAHTHKMHKTLNIRYSWLLHWRWLMDMEDWWIHRHGTQCGASDSRMQWITTIMNFFAAAMLVNWSHELRIFALTLLSSPFYLFLSFICTWSSSVRFVHSSVWLQIKFIFNLTFCSRFMCELR